jgi:hypothetical protein
METVFLSFLLSLLAAAISAYTFWDNKFRFKLEVSVGKQTKLFVGKVDTGKVQPILFLSLAFANLGGKTGCIDDVKILVKIIAGDKVCLEREFEALREYDSLLGDASDIKQTEILPVVVIGRTTEVRKYVFFPSKYIDQTEIPRSFDLDVMVMTKQGGKWSMQKEYEIKRTDNVWQDLDELANWRYNTRDLFEKA